MVGISSIHHFNVLVKLYKDYSITRYTLSLFTTKMYCNVAGGELPDGKQFTLKAPGVRRHPRWMSKVIYTIKIAMLQHQLKNDIPEHFLMNIVALAQFFCLYYVKSWPRATLHFQAPSDNLNLYKTFLTNAKYHKSEDIRQLSQAATTKFESHLWYLTERLVVLSLFSDASIQQKQNMAKQIKKFKKQFQNYRVNCAANAHCNFFYSAEKFVWTGI